MNQKEFSKPVSLRRVQLTDSFWKMEMELVRQEMIPYQWDALNDRVEGAEPSYCMRNFKIAANITKQRAELGEAYQEKKFSTEIFQPLPEDENLMEDRFYGFLFQDSDFYKWIEAVGYSLTQHPDKELERIADEAIEIVSAAQQPNGYLDTYYIINNMDHIFTNLRNNHELYCLGHLTEGAIAYYEATGKDRLLKVAERYADYVESLFGAEDGKLKGYPGHEIAEMALARLYETTNNEKYLKLSKYFIDERGKKPYYFDSESKEKIKDKDALRYQYYQAHLPVREQTEAVGHAVRAAYLYSGMADIARLTQDESLYKACETIWDDMVSKKLYITGGIGGTHIGEAFSFAYDLPNDTAYAETCASIGLVFFARRMLEIKPNRKYADVMEKALYNCVLSGMALDGKSFFYVNPLEVLPEACHKDERKFHVKPVRQKWFGCACCPPNLARIISSIASYAYTETEDTLFVHLYMGSRINKVVQNNDVSIDITSSFPWDGAVTVQVDAAKPTTMTIALRIPEWCNEYEINAPSGDVVEKDGYYYITREWNGTETITMNFPMKVKRIYGNPMLRENIGKVAITRGPIVYCIEEADNGNNLHLVTLPKEAQLSTHTDHRFGYEVTIIKGTGRKLKLTASSSNELYHGSEEEQFEDINLTWIPYYTWANRGEGEMMVWIRQ
ncbi:glycoside hydrolase family 127 protein [Lachnospiraceae bacterium MD1]|jgi:DUF1680 family protein|uniref:Glycoside hydrolase family 127 protein n=1 Tax=Variimorphobacter saccharofermentans TaxID=2755051 RepID=A0A839K2T9_9FIRM|nr:beta-L-arabinofuranosidase domain-containing protein [Variimorphobacter saccharofermentans]MBB2183936.1 glycoside hydrolase family 127 protein [Variimorphobacter saccharofermentans]